MHISFILFLFCALGLHLRQAVFAACTSCQCNVAPPPCSQQLLTNVNTSVSVTDGQTCGVQPLLSFNPNGAIRLGNATSQTSVLGSVSMPDIGTSALPANTLELVFYNPTTGDLSSGVQSSVCPSNTQTSGNVLICDGTTSGSSSLISVAPLAVNIGAAGATTRILGDVDVARDLIVHGNLTVVGVFINEVIALVHINVTGAGVFVTVTVADPLMVEGVTTLRDSVSITGNLNVSGTVRTGSIIVSGVSTLASAWVTGTLSVSGTSTLSSASITGALAVAGSSTLASTSITGTLGVAGLSTLAATVVNGNLNVSQTVTAAAGAVSGNLLVGGSAALGSSSITGALVVGGSSTLASASVTGTLAVAGSSTLATTNVNGNLNVSQTITTVAETVTGNLVVGGPSTLGSASVTGALTVGGSSTLALASVTGTLGVAGISTLATTVVNGNLNVSQTVTAAAETISGNLVVGGSGTLGAASVTGSLFVGGSSTLASASVAGTLGVAGISTLATTVVNGNLNVSQTITTVAETVSGNLVVGGSATMASASVTGNLVAASETVLGNMDITGLMTSGNATVLGSAVIQGNVTIFGTLTSLNRVSSNVTGDSLIGGNLDVLGTTIMTGDIVTRGSLNVAQTTTTVAAHVTGNLVVDGSATLGSSSVTGALGVSGISTLASASVTGTLGVSGISTLATTVVNGNLNVSQTVRTAAEIISGNLVVGGSATLGSASVTGALTVGGDSALAGNLGVAGISTLAATNVNGNLNVSGPTIVLRNVPTAPTSSNAVLVLAPGTGLVQVSPLHVCPGGMTCVDQVYGNDATGAVGAGHFLTINAALAATASGQACRIYPGTYAETFTIPQGVSVRGVDQQAVVIQALNPAAGSTTTLVTMSTQTRLEDVTLKITTSTHSTLYGIAFQGSSGITSTVAYVRMILDNSAASSTGNSTVVGILVNGTGQSSGAITNVLDTSLTINSAGGGTKRAILVQFTTTSIFVVRASNFQVANFTSSSTTTGSYIAAETSTTQSTLRAYAGSFAALSSDVSQTNGTLALIGTRLSHSTTNGLSVTYIIDPSTIVFSLFGTLGAGTTFLFPGSATKASGTESFYRITQRCVVSYLSVVVTRPPNPAVSFTVRKNQVATTLTATMAAGSATASDTTHAVTFQAGDVLSVTTTAGAGTKPTNIVLTLAKY